jgi:hypothetical protein
MNETSKVRFAPVADRNALIEGAAKQLNALRNLQTGAGTFIGETPEAKLIRTLTEDEGRFADRPQVIPITKKAYFSAKMPVPIAVDKLLKRYRFYLLKFSFDLHPAKGWAFNSLTMQVEFAADHGSERSKVYALFPNKKFSQILKVGGKVQATLGASIDFEAGLAPQHAASAVGSVSAGGSVHNSEKVELSCLAGPFTLEWKKSLIKASQPGLEWAWWQLAGSQFNEGDDPGLMLVAQVPSEARRVELRGQFTAKRKFAFFDYGVQNAILHLDDVFGRFFKGGTPYDHGPVSWDLTPHMQAEGDAR